MESPKKIISDVAEIKSYLKKNRKNKNLEENAKEEFKDFEYKYPVIFKKILDNTLDNEQFLMMMNMMQKMQDNELTEHDASVQVGQVLVDKYVKPMLEKKDN